MVQTPNLSGGAPFSATCACHTKKKVCVPYIRILSQIHAYPHPLLWGTASPSLLNDGRYSITQWGTPGEEIT